MPLLMGKTSACAHALIVIVMAAVPISAAPPVRAGTGIYDFSIYPEFGGQTVEPSVNYQPQPAEPAEAWPPTVTETAELKADSDGWISEVRLGVLAHNVGPIASKTEDGIDVNPEILFSSAEFLEPIWAPRPMLGATINTIGDTSIFYGGLMWTFDMWWDTFVDFSFGMAVHNGNSGSETDSEGRRALGCRWLFRESLELGYRFNPTYAVSLYLDHVSHGGVCSSRNRGMDNSGVRFHYAF